MEHSHDHPMRRPTEVGPGSWLQAHPVTSLDLIRACELKPDDPIIDVSGADFRLIDALLAAGHRDITVLDGSLHALGTLRERLGDRSRCVTLVNTDPLHFNAHRRYALWHDRCLFQLLTHPEERQQYVEVVQQALRPDGQLVIAACSLEAAGHADTLPLRRYTAQTLPQEFGRQFELTDSSVAVHQPPGGEPQSYLHCRFRRHAPPRLSGCAARTMS